MFAQAALIAAIAFVLALAVLSWRSYQQQHQAQQQTSAEESQKETNNVSLSDNAEDAIAQYTLLLSVFTGLLAFFALIQIYFLIENQRTSTEAANAAKKSAQIAERALIAGQRAFVSVAYRPSANLGDKDGKITNWTFTPIWSNAGDTPTRNMTNHITRMLFDKEIPPDWDFPNGWDAATPKDKRKNIILGIGPKGWIEGQSVSVTVAEMADVISGKKFMYLWGWAIYDDVFPNTARHVTRFAVRILAGGDPHNKDRISFSYPILEKYNCSDEECDHQGYPVSWTARNIDIE